MSDFSFWKHFERYAMSVNQNIQAEALIKDNSHQYIYICMYVTLSVIETEN